MTFSTRPETGARSSMQQPGSVGAVALEGLIKRAARLARTPCQTATWAFALVKEASLLSMSNLALSRAAAETVCVCASA
jgi:hypothetical protein